MASSRIAQCLGVALLLTLGSVRSAPAGIADLETTDAPPPERVETTEITDPAGNMFQVETRTDAFGRRQRIVRPLAGASSVVPAPESAPESVPAPAEKPASSARGWRSMGPDGGDVASIAISPLDPRIVVAGMTSVSGSSARAGIYRSEDGGRSWSAADLSMATQSSYYQVGRIEFGADGVAWAATSHGLWRSTDGGATWRTPSGASSSLNGSAVCVEPGDPRRLWVGLVRGGGIVRSLDGGNTWQSLPLAGLGRDLDCRGIAFDPARPGVVAACFGNWTDGQVWFSANSGASWTNRTLGLPSTMYNDILFDGTRWLIAGGDNISFEDIMGVYASSNDGSSWTNITLPWSGRVLRGARDIELDPSNRCVIWVAHPQGVMMSADCGAHWTFNAGRSDENVLCVKAAAGGTLFAGTECFAVMRREGTGDFVPSSSGIRELIVTSVASHPLDPRELAVSFEGLNLGGVYLTHDGGESWQLDTGIRARVPLLQYGGNGTLYCICDGPIDRNRVGVHRRNSSSFWAAIGPRQGVYFDTHLAWFQVSPQDPQLILAGGLDHSNGGFAGAIWRTTNGGNSWTTVYRQAADTYYGAAGILIDDGSDRIAIASPGMPSGPVLLRSEDRGATWSEPEHGFGPPELRASSFAFSPGAPAQVFATGRWGGGFYRSFDLGRNWEASPAGGGFSSLVCHPGDPSVLFGFGSPARLLRSRDSGGHFESFREGLPPTTYAMRMSFSSDPCPRLMLATSSGAWVRSADSRPPQLSFETDPHELWPPDHRMVDVHARVQVRDECDPSPTFVLSSITTGDPEAAGDVAGAEPGRDDTDFELRATRPGRGGDRIYSIRYTATDAEGNAAEVEQEVRVPHDRSEHSAGNAPRESVDGLAPLETGLQQVAPSPFRFTASVAFALAAPAPVRVEVFDLRGATVRTLLDGFRPAGRHRIDWDGRDGDGNALAGGVYWIRFSTPDHRELRKIVRLR